MYNNGSFENGNLTFVWHFDQSVGFHFIQNLLPRLRLAHQIRVRAARGNELLDIRNLGLLLLVEFHSVGVLLGAGFHVGVEVTTPVSQLLLLHDHHICAHAVQKVLTVTDDNQNLGIRRKVLFEPHTCF